MQGKFVPGDTLALDLSGYQTNIRQIVFKVMVGFGTYNCQAITKGSNDKKLKIVCALEVVHHYCVLYYSCNFKQEIPSGD